jgi:hypothetical protein
MFLIYLTKNQGKCRSTDRRCYKISHSNIQPQKVDDEVYFLSDKKNFSFLCQIGKGRQHDTDFSSGISRTKTVSHIKRITTIFIITKMNKYVLLAR